MNKTKILVPVDLTVSGCEKADEETSLTEQRVCPRNQRETALDR